MLNILRVLLEWPYILNQKLSTSNLPDSIAVILFMGLTFVQIAWFLIIASVLIFAVSTLLEGIYG